MMLTRHEFERIAGERGDCLISIYLPTHRKGAETDQDRIRLKNHLAAVDKRLSDEPAKLEPLAPGLKRAKDLVGDPNFWRHQGEGLALLISPEGLHIYRLDVPVTDFVYTGERFCVRPLLPSVTEGDRFYILALSQNRVRLIECSRNSAREVTDHDIPESLQDALGYDYEERSLQFHTEAQRVGPAATRAAMFHGQGAGNDDKKGELEQFFHRIDDALDRLFGDKHLPIIVAAVESEIARFNQIARYPGVMEKGVAGNPDHLSEQDLHEKALPLAEERLAASSRQRADRIASMAHTGSVASGVVEVLPAVLQSRVERMLVRPERPVWGRVQNERSANGSFSVEAHENHSPGDDDLLDLAISRAVASGAEVLTASAGDMPGGARLTATLRY